MKVVTYIAIIITRKSKRKRNAANTYHITLKELVETVTFLLKL